jgi:hypothetical protein
VGVAIRTTRLSKRYGDVQALAPQSGLTGTASRISRTLRANPPLEFSWV